MSLPSNPAKSPSIRYPFLDWARIIGIFCVFLYHSGRAFDFEDWHVKNPVPSEGITIWLGFLILWIMPLMFVISGVSSYLSLRSRTAGRFLRDRVLRLLVPLVAMGMLIFGPYQIYLERLTHGQFSGSLLAFLPHYFEGWYYPGQPGNAVLAGHVTIPDAGWGPFKDLETLQAGDRIFFEDGDKVYMYEVTDQMFVEPTDVWVAYPTDDTRLTLITCAGWSDEVEEYTQRIVVVAMLVP